MVLQNIDINSTLVEELKKSTEGEMILGRTCDLACMKLCSITPTHQVLENGSSSVYKEEIQKLGMTYQLIQPDKHRRNLA